MITSTDNTLHPMSVSSQTITMSPDDNKHFKNWFVTEPKKEKKTKTSKPKKESRITTRYILNIYKDKGMTEYLNSPLIRHHDKKLARKDMMELACLHLTQGLYYFYELVEEKKTPIETYPN
jgi:hypothetical protein